MEPYGELTRLAFELLDRMIRRDAVLITSAFGLGELLVKPARSDPARVRAYRDFVLRTAEVWDFNLASTDIYARIRGSSNIKAPDAIQLACAATARADLFVTNDDRLVRANVAGVPRTTSLAAVQI